MAYFHCLIGGGSSGGGYELTVTCDADFAGTTITCTDGVTTLTQTCPSASPYEVVFAIPNGGEWTISGIISGQTYSTAIDIPDSLELSSVPEGSTVLPTDDIQTWLACAGIKDKSYTTLNEVLADSTTLLALMSDDNASDYLVRSTTWASGITADSTAMTDIGANNYCANTLLSDSTWASAIENSTYYENVLNVKIPTMTGYTTPSGEAYGSSEFNATNQYWRAFDGTSQVWAPSTQQAGEYVAYDFGKPIIAIKTIVRGINANSRYPFTFKVQASDNKNFSDIDYESGTFSVTQNVDTAFDIRPNNAYRYWRMYMLTYTEYISISKFQLIGREDV